VLATGAAGALLVLLVQRLTSSSVALLAFGIWLVTANNLQYHATYLSQVTTSALWLAGCWALLRWCETERRAWLLVVAACVAWGLISRPLTMLAYSIPVGVVVLVTMRRRVLWRQLPAALAVGLAILVILPFWNAETTGSWRTMSWARYAELYMPWDTLGFGLDSTPPQRDVPEDMRRLAGEFATLHADYVPKRIPSEILERSAQLWTSAVGQQLGWIKPFAALGLVLLTSGFAGPAGLFAVGGAVCHLVAHLAYVQARTWPVYQLEIEFLVPIASAFGLWVCAGAVAQGLVRLWPSFDAERERIRALVIVATLVLVVPIGWRRISDARDWGTRFQAYYQKWRYVLANVPLSPAIVFVRYKPNHSAHFSLISNDPNLAEAPIWVVYDRGTDNARLLEAAPDRVAYLFDEATWTLQPLPR
jgi:4-amino-4-deoxy-L-arabinose transferase-like glycosyltransferase